MSPSHVCIASGWLGVHAWPGPQSLPCFCTQPRPGKSWLNLVTLASGAVGLPVHRLWIVTAPPLSMGISHAPEPVRLFPPREEQLPIFTPCSILVEAPCRPSRDGRVKAGGEDRSSHKPDATDFYWFCLKYMAVLQTDISQMAVGLQWISRALIVLLVWVYSHLGDWVS